MTPVEIAAHQAADRDKVQAERGDWSPWDSDLQTARDLYVRAFLAGRQHTVHELRPLLTHPVVNRMYQAAVDAALED